MKDKKVEVMICSICKFYKTTGQLKDHPEYCGCKKEIWKLKTAKLSRNKFFKKLDTAKKCEYFKPLK